MSARHEANSPPLDLLIVARIGLGHEPSAVLAIQRVETLLDEYDDKVGWKTDLRYEVPAIERLSGGSSQSAAADTIAELVELGKGNKADRVKVVVDISQVGLPFRQLLRDRGVRAAAVMISDASKTRPDKRFWQIPQRELISVSLGVLADGRVEVADLPQAQALNQQLAAFSTKPPPRDALADWRPVPQTDLAQALMLGLWWSERMQRSIVVQPRPPRTAPEQPRPITFDDALKIAGVGRRKEERVRI